MQSSSLTIAIGFKLLAPALISAYRQHFADAFFFAFNTYRTITNALLL
jgi:hypothetical protein